MTVHEPSALEVFITVAAGYLLGRTYATAVEHLRLMGSERVLDFGSGAGTPARLLARELLDGGGCVTCVDVSEVWLRTARKRLAQFPNVDFKLGEIFQVDVPDASHDVVFVHFVIHDIPASQRPGVVRHLARKLVAGGTLFIREPLNVIAQEEIRRLMQQSGLVERRADIGRVPLMGATFEGIYRKEGQDHA